MTTLRDQLLAHEGLRLKPYRDTVGKWTIGVGRNLADKGITKDEALYLLDNDIAECEAQLRQALPWAMRLNETRWRVLVDMCFNLGIRGLLGFTTALGHMEKGEFGRAAEAMLASKWAEQVKGRAARLAKWMREGEMG